MDTTKDTTSEEKGFFKKFIDDVTTNVKEGAAFVGDKVAETSAKAYVAGSELVSETSDKIHDFTEKQTLHKEEEKIAARQIKIKQEFGVMAFDQYLETKALEETFLNTDAVQNLWNEFKKNEVRLGEITIELDSIEKH